MPIDTDLERLRLTIGDTDSTAQIFSDEELQWFLDAHTGDDKILLAGADACDAAALKYARAYDFETDNQRFDRSQMQKAFKEMAGVLRARAAGLIIGAGGVLVGSVSTVDSTRVDGYSEDIPNQQVRAGSVNRRQDFYTVDGLDHLP